MSTCTSIAALRRYYKKITLEKKFRGHHLPWFTRTILAISLEENQISLAFQANEWSADVVVSETFSEISNNNNNNNNNNNSSSE